MNRIPIFCSQPTANGPHGTPGVSAQPLVAEESKTEHEPFYKLLQTEAKNAKDQLLNSEIATPQNAQVKSSFILFKSLFQIIYPIDFLRL